MRVAPNSSTNRTSVVVGGLCSLVAVGVGLRYLRKSRTGAAPSPSDIVPSTTAPATTARGGGGSISPIVKSTHRPVLVRQHGEDHHEGGNDGGLVGPGNATTSSNIDRHNASQSSTSSSNFALVHLVVESDCENGDDDDLDVGSYVHVAQFEDACNHSLWNITDNAFCGRFGFVRRVDADGDIEVSFSDGKSVVCDRRFVVLDEAPGKSASVTSLGSNGSQTAGGQQRQPSPNRRGGSTNGLSNASSDTHHLEYTGMGKMASSFSGMMTL